MPFCADNVHNYKFGIVHLSIVKTVPFLNNNFQTGAVSSNLNRNRVRTPCKSLKVLEFKKKKFKALKVLENCSRYWKVLEF